MALILAFVNKSALAEISDYDVKVWINHRQIDSGQVTGHRRSDGYLELLRKFVDQRPRSQPGAPDGPQHQAN